MAQLANQEIESLNRAMELFDSQYFDLSVVEAWRALEARLRQVLLNRGIVTDATDSQAVIHVAVKKGILKEPTLGLVAELKRHWMVAVSTEPLSQDAANESLSAVRHILSVIPVKVHAVVPDARPEWFPQCPCPCMRRVANDWILSIDRDRSKGARPMKISFACPSCAAPGPWTPRPPGAGAVQALRASLHQSRTPASPGPSPRATCWTSRLSRSRSVGDELRLGAPHS